MPDRREEILKMLTVLAENFEAAPSPARLAMVVKELEPFSLEQITEGLTRLLRTRKYPGFPTLAEILEAVAGNEQERAKLAAHDAWSRLLVEMERVGSYGKPDLDPISETVVRVMGGWESLCRALTYASLTFRHRDFVDLYTRYAIHGTPEQRQLTGSPEAKRLVEGLH